LKNLRVALPAALFLLALASLASAGGRPFLYGLFGDGMVLQRDRPCPLWGWTTPGAAVTVAVDDQPVTVRADAQGKWVAPVGPYPAGGPHTVTISGSQTVTLKNVLFGDVWICSGQSNMEMGLKSVNQWWDELNDADYPQIRFYTVPFDSRFSPATNITASWRVCNRDTVSADQPIWGGFSAIGFFFGREVYKQTKVPQGLIESCWGATDIQAWSTLPSLRTLRGYEKADPRADYAKQMEDSWQKLDPNYAATQSWSDPAYDASAWKTLDLPHNWQETALPGFTGVVWFRKEVQAPASWAGKSLTLSLGVIDSADTVWFNGSFVDGNSNYGTPLAREYDVPGALVRAGRNVLVVRVRGERGFVGKPEQMALQLAGPSTDPPVSLAGPWLYQASTPSAQLKGGQAEHRYVATGCYEGMIAPLAPLALKGAIWYQGEGNVGNADLYKPALTNLIRDWRSLFGVAEMPFYLVQLAGFWQLPDKPGGSGWALVREAQWQVTQTVPHTGLAVAMDRGELYNIHPPNKLDVGLRLARVALADTYGLPVEYLGPSYKSLAVEGGTIRVSLDHATGLVSRGSGPTGFAVAGADKQFFWASAVRDGETVVLSAPQVPAPVAVRYGWGDNALCNLYNQAGLPAVPFRTDTW
jgi:sialate O-acetylesterase